MDKISQNDAFESVSLCKRWLNNSVEFSLDKRGGWGDFSYLKLELS